MKKTIMSIKVLIILLCIIILTSFFLISIFQDRDKQIKNLQNYINEFINRFAISIYSPYIEKSEYDKLDEVAEYLKEYLISRDEAKKIEVQLISEDISETEESKTKFFYNGKESLLKELESNFKITNNEKNEFYLCVASQVERKALFKTEKTADIYLINTYSFFSPNDSYYLKDEGLFSISAERKLGELKLYLTNFAPDFDSIEYIPTISHIRITCRKTLISKKVKLIIEAQQIFGFRNNSKIPKKYVLAVDESYLHGNKFEIKVNPLLKNNIEKKMDEKKTTMSDFIIMKNIPIYYIHKEF